MLSIAWKEEARFVTKEEPIRGVFVGKTDISINDLWKENKTKSNQSY
jgi:hypothetical protein